MEVDGDLVDQQLLQQFSCMGTTDKDELIKQFQMLVGNNLNSNSARFFLDMNNWNLQAAVGSYFDFDQPPPKPPSMVLIRDENDSGCINVLPNTEVEKVWTLLNSGEDSWPSGCHLQFTAGQNMTKDDRIYVEPIEPRQTIKVTVKMTAPEEPGVYTSTWKMVTSTGAYFGDAMWIILTVTEPETEAELALQLSQMSTENTPQSEPSSENRSQPNPFTPWEPDYF